MQQSSLVELVKVLTARELKDFSLFLESPYHNRGRYRKEAQNLFKILVKYAPDYANDKLSKEKIYRQVFPEDPFTEGRIEKVMVELSKSIRLFLVTEYYLREDNQPSVQTDYAQILMDRSLIQRSANQVRVVLEELEQSPIKNAQLYDRLYKGLILSYSIETERNTWKEDLNIGKALRFLDLYYFASRLNLLNHFLLLRKYARVNSQIDLAREKMIEHLFVITPEESPVVFIARKIFNLYSDGNTSLSDFEELLLLLRQHESAIDQDNAKFFFSYLRNYCSTLITQGHQHLWPALHAIQRDNLEKGYFYYQNTIPPGAFLSIANTAIRVNKLEWVQEFIENHRYRVMGDNEQQDYYRLVFANYLFAIKDYERALDYIPPASPNMDFHLWGRRLELKTYYELGSELLPYKIDAFKMYLSRGRHKVLSDHNYEININFINILNQLMQSKPGDVGRKETMLRRIEEKKQIFGKDWLIEKAQRLK